MQIPTDEVIITTAVEQVGHFKVVLAALGEINPALAVKTRHIAHGLLQLTTGKMSSRKGNIITASELIKEMIETALERNENPLAAEQVAIGAIKYILLRSAPGQNIIFDPEKSLSLDGDSGPYLQYALVRARSVQMPQRQSTNESRAKENFPYKQLKDSSYDSRKLSRMRKIFSLHIPSFSTSHSSQVSGIHFMHRTELLVENLKTERLRLQKHS